VGTVWLGGRDQEHCPGKGGLSSGAGLGCPCRISTVVLWPSVRASCQKPYCHHCPTLTVGDTIPCPVFTRPGNVPVLLLWLWHIRASFPSEDPCGNHDTGKGRWEDVEVAGCSVAGSQNTASRDNFCLPAGLRFQGVSAFCMRKVPSGWPAVPAGMVWSSLLPLVEREGCCLRLCRSVTSAGCWADVTR